MANTFLTPSVIAREALMVLQNNLVMAGLVHRDYSEEFSEVGDTVMIRKPPVFEAKEFTQGGNITVQDATEASTTVKLDKHLDVSFAVTPKQMTLEIADFSAQLLQPAVRALAQKVDEYLCALYAAVPYRVGTAGTTPDGLDDFANARKDLLERGVPLSDLRLVVDPAAEAKFLVLDSLVEADKSGTTEALRNANLGRVMGFDTYVDQNIVTHVAGTGTTAGKVAVDLAAGYEAGATEIHVDGVATALKVGDQLTIGSAKHVVVAASALATADQDITIYPGLTADVANDAEIALVGNYTANLAFHRNALALVSRPLARPLGAASSDQLAWNGLSIRVAYGYDITKKVDTVSLDMLVGAKCIYPELACVLMG